MKIFKKRNLLLALLRVRLCYRVKLVGNESNYQEYMVNEKGTRGNVQSISYLLHSYCVHAVDLMVPEAYEIVFFNSAMNGTNIPTRQLIKQCYDTIQYR